VITVFILLLLPEMDTYLDMDTTDLSRAVRELASHFRRRTKPTLAPAETDHNASRFLSLPRRIRMRVYEGLPLQIKHHDVEYQGSVCLTLIARGLPLAILRTCSKVYDEAQSLMRARIQREIAGAPLRIILRGEVDASLAARHNTYLVLSAMAYAVEVAKRKLQLGYKTMKTILPPVEDK
jgi:hypothetical protein